MTKKIKITTGTMTKDGDTMTNWYEFYYNEIVNDANQYLADHFENYVVRNNDGDITDYADADTIEDALWISDEVCGNAENGHPRIPDDIGNVIFSDVFMWYVRDYGYPEIERLTDTDGREYLDCIIRCSMLSECLPTIYNDFENMVVADGR